MWFCRHFAMVCLCRWSLPRERGFQELEVRDSGVDWVLARPVHLTDDESDDMPFASADGQVREWKISRKGVARFLAFAAQGPDYVGQSVALSGAGVSG